MLAAWGVADRCSTVSGSFFDEVHAGYDAYILKEIIHDWDDARALAILAVCRRAMRPGATLLIMEMVVVVDDQPHFAKLLDMEMLDVANEGRQRTAEEFRALLERSGFRMTGVIALPSPVSIVAAIAV